MILFYGGLVRRKNVLGTMMHSLVLMGLVSLLWVLFQYSMAFEGNAYCGNPSPVAYSSIDVTPNADYTNCTVVAPTTVRIA